MTAGLSPGALAARLEAGEPTAVLDVRPALDYAAGHLRQCTPVPRVELERRLPALVPNRRATVVLVDERGERGAADAAWLRELGYGAATHLVGGVEAWRDAGRGLVGAEEDVPNTAFNVPSKAFGERVHVEDDVPALTPDELRERLDGDAPPVVVDVRTPEEYREWAIPGAVNAEGVELVRYVEALREADRPVVVNCAGRTRSIIGTATLRAMGLEDVYELEDGTMGWLLAGYDVERGADRHLPPSDPGEAARERAREFADRLRSERDLATVDVGGLRERLSDAARTVYVIDVRTEAEYADGHLPGSRSVPGGQAVQTADEHVAVRPADVVFVSDEGTRATVTAAWYDRMGVGRPLVLEGGLDAWREAGGDVEAGPDEPAPADAGVRESLVAFVEPPALHAELAAAEVVDVDRSERYAEAHVPGARWVDRYDLEATLDALGPDAAVVLTCRDGERSGAAAAMQAATDGRDVRVLRGGLVAWRAADLPVESGPPAVEPRDDYEKPYFDERAMRAYLDWERRLGEAYARGEDPLGPAT